MSDGKYQRNTSGREPRLSSGKTPRHTTGGPTTCCCEEDPCFHTWIRLKDCDTGEDTNYYFLHGPCVGDTGEVASYEGHIFYVGGAVGCLYVPSPQTYVVGTGTNGLSPPTGGTNISDVGGYIGNPLYALYGIPEDGSSCDYYLCNDGLPWGDPKDPPPAGCGCDASFENTAECVCEPDTIRVTLDGVDPCTTCVECGNIGQTSARLSAGQTIDGTYDLARYAPGEWMVQVYRNHDYSFAPDAACSTTDVAELFTLWLKKVSATQWQFAIVSGGFVYIGVEDPHYLTDLCASFAVQYMILFKGSATGPDRSCLNVPTMTNELTCGSEDYVCPDPGDPEVFYTACHFYISANGTATFDSCL